MIIQNPTTNHCCSNPDSKVMPARLEHYYFFKNVWAFLWASLCWVLMYNSYWLSKWITFAVKQTWMPFSQGKSFKISKQWNIFHHSFFSFQQHHQKLIFFVMGSGWPSTLLTNYKVLGKSWERSRVLFALHTHFLPIVLARKAHSLGLGREKNDLFPAFYV